MVNILGDLWRDGPPPFERALALPGVRLHLYGKREARSGRKMGHLTALADSADGALALGLEAWRAIGGREA
jgi:5-(carboxyamino)imidazole ribonucleotide synthase